MPEIQVDGNDQAYIEVPNGWAAGEYIRITRVDRQEEDVGIVIRIQRHIEGRAPDPGPEMAVTKILPFVEALMHLLREEGHTVS